jgi:oxalate decarboxylase/phosphoglucose isomerase-like protein (cupin superfamily)
VVGTGQIVEEGDFDPAEFAYELAAAAGNLEVGTRLWFANDRIKVWEVRLEPGQRGPFHAHTRRYFWTVVEGGTGRQRSPDGTFRVRTYELGDTQYAEHDPDHPLIHDLENVGPTTMRFVTVELLDYTSQD